MKLFKKILLALFLIVLVGGTVTFFYFKNKFLTAPPNELTVSNFEKPFDFSWSVETINGKRNPHAAMLVPVSVSGVDHKFFMQFDTGAVSTLLYYNPILSINEAYGEIFKIDTIKGKVRAIETSFKVGTVDVSATSLGFERMGKKLNLSDSTAIHIIGTVGNDFMEKIL